MLPNIKFGSGTVGTSQDKFGGIDHRLSASDGDIYDMMNMSSENFPLLSPRASRRLVRSHSGNGEVFADDELYYIDSGSMYVYIPTGNDVKVLSGLSSGEKQIAKIKTMICIFPDKVYYDTESGESGSLEVKLEGIKVEFEDGTLFDENAKQNALTSSSVILGDYFKVGDAVEITGCTKNPENNVTPIVREISENKMTLYFYEFTFTNGSETGVTLSRTLPEMDFVFENENRLWGCKGNDVYCSKLGDPTNWRSYDGIASSSYQVSVGSAGSFTAACSFLGYPLFFKEEKIYRMYGNAPESFQLMSSATLGVAKGSHKSLAIAGETLFYVSRAGVVAYGGGVPSIISTLLGETISEGVGGTDGLKYYLSAVGTDHGRVIYVYDTQTGGWYIENDVGAVSFAFHGRELYCVGADGIYVMNRTDSEYGESEGTVRSVCEFADWYDDYADKKELHKMELRLFVDFGAKVTVYIKYDTSDVWEQIHTTDGFKKGHQEIPIITQRSDHYRIKIEGVGRYVIYNITREYSRGSGARI